MLRRSIIYVCSSVSSTSCPACRCVGYLKTMLAFHLEQSISIDLVHRWRKGVSRREQPLIVVMRVKSVMFGARGLQCTARVAVKGG